MNRQAEERLSRYLDGDLTAGERAEVEAWLSVSAEGRAVLRQLEAIGEVVRAVDAERRENAPDLADAILARVEREPVAPAAGYGATSHGTGGGVAGPGIRWLRLAPPVGLAVAAAAAVALLLREPGDAARPGPGSALSVAAEAARPADPGPVAEVSPVEPEGGASIESVDFGAHNGTIFMVAGGADVTPVVWLVDEPEPAGDRMTPL